MKTKPINWKTTRIETRLIKPTPNNFKLKTAEGLSRLETSLERYGMAGSLILNKDLTLINGNSRWEKAQAQKIKYLECSLPDRMLTVKEFTEFAAMFDFAVAGEVDLLRIKEELGTHDSFFKAWNIPIPTKALNKLAEMERNEAVINPTQAKAKAGPKEIATTRITLLLTKDEYDEYIRIAEGLYTQFKVDNVTDLSLAALRYVKNNINGKKK
jgi:hypothetical protein